MAKRLSVLMLGWRSSAVMAARSMGLRTVVLYTPRQLDKGSVTPEIADATTLVEDVSNVEHILRALHRVDVDGCVAVTTQEEWSATAAGLIARELGTKGPDPKVAIYFRDKALQKQRLNDAGIETATYLEVEDIHAGGAREQIRSFGFPSVLKPVAGAAAVSTVLIPDEARVDAALEFVRNDRYNRRRFLVEAAQPGEEWHVDGWVQDGEVRFAAVSRYMLKEGIGEEAVPASVILDPREDTWSYGLGRQLTADSLCALGLGTGVFHLEAFFDPARRRLVFSECAYRVGGAYIYETVLAKFGVDLHRASVTLAIGAPADERVTLHDEAFGWTGLALKTGYGAASRPSLNEVAAQPGVVECRYVPRMSSRTSSQLPPVGPAAEAVVKATSTDHLVSRMIGLRDWFATAP
jgi:biotin carboxylase